MKRFAFSTLTIVTLGARLASSAPADRVPVLVELFTSEGCSSCPPADRLLQRLIATQPVPGAEIIPLAHHVDYWDRLGWRDPFSSRQATARQTIYAEMFGSDQVYTPQLVVDGRVQFVGSQETRAEEEIARAAKTGKGRLELTRTGGDGSQVKLKISVRDLPAFSPNDEAEVVLALTESGVASEVAKGENKGRRLEHAAVVRDFARLGQIKAPGEPFAVEGSVERPKGVKADALSAVAFVQEKKSRRVLAVARLAIP